MNLSIETGIPALTVFLQGLFSFFSPCVLPLVPLYVSYLAGGAKTGPDGALSYPRGRVMINTFCFVLGVSFAFFSLGLGFSALGRFFSGNRMLFARISGILMIFLGIYQTGFLGKSQKLEQEKRFHLRLDKLPMNPFVAWLLGFTFSFAWTPCVGPALASVLLMVSTAASPASGYLLIGVYTLGFVIPFLLVGLFTSQVLEFFKRHGKVMAYSVKIGAVLMILLGVMTLTGFMNGITGYLSSFTGSSTSQTQQQAASQEQEKEEEAGNAAEEEKENQDSAARELPAAPDFTLTDQNGVRHTLSDYKGKVVLLNFWATWCGPCKMEMPDLQAVYEDYGKNQEDVVILGVANPKTPSRPQNSDVTTEEVVSFLQEGGYTYPTAMDETGQVFLQYGVSAFPTTFMITPEGKVYGYATGTLTRGTMENFISQTKQAGEK